MYLLTLTTYKNAKTASYLNKLLVILKEANNISKEYIKTDFWVDF